MIDEPMVVELAARPAAVIPFRIPKAKIGEVMGPAFGELFAALGAQGIAPAGPAFSHHARFDPEYFEFEVGVPVSKPIAPTGRVKPGELPGGRVITTIYRGGYEGLGGGWGEFMKWIDASDHKTGPNFWEIYAAGPESGPDESQWRTELVRPLA